MLPETSLPQDAKKTKEQLLDELAALRQQAAERIQLFADVVKNVQVGLVVWQLEDVDDPNSLRLLTANPVASQMTGANLEARIGTTLKESFPALLETHLMSDYAEVVRTGKSKNMGEFRSSDGKLAQIFSLKAFGLPNQCLD